MHDDEPTPLLEVRGLGCERDGRRLFEDLEFTLRGGEILHIAGPNGCGKTTLLRSLAGLSTRCRGEIFWCGVPVAEDVYGFRAGSFYIGHDTGIKLSLSAVENLRWHCALYARDRAGEIEGALAGMGLAHCLDVPARQLSAGQRRRAGLARLPLCHARLWILDEPFTAIDPAGVRRVEAMIERFTGEGGAVLLTTHQPLGIARAVRTLELTAPERRA